MSEKTVHWPTADGSPDIDFTPQARAVEQEPVAPVAPAQQPDADAPDNRSAAAAWAWAPTAAPAGEALAAGAGDAQVDARTAIGNAAAAGARRSGHGAPAVTVEPMPAPRSRLGTRRTRKARLRIARIDPWSVMKTSFLFSIAFGIIMMVISWVLWTVLAGSGALESVNHFVTTLIGDQEGQAFDITQWINGSRVLGLSALLAAVDVVILTAVATLFAFLYNLAATVIGGLEVTLAED